MEIVYFNIEGRALDLRLAAAIGELQFKDTRIEFKDFPKLKPSLPFGQVPILKDAGKTYAQSMPILKYIGKKAGLFPKDESEQMDCEIIIHTMEDLMTPIIVSFGPERYGLPPFKGEKKGEKEKLEMRKNIVENIWPAKFAKMEEFLKQNFKETGYAAGKALSIADIRIFVTVKSLKSGFLDGVPKDFIDKYPTMLAIYEKVGELDAVKKWLKIEAEHASKKK